MSAKSEKFKSIIMHELATEFQDQIKQGITALDLNEIERYRYSILDKFIEIEIGFERLKRSSIYIKRRPSSYKIHNIDKAEYLWDNVVFHMHAIWAVLERVRGLIGTIKNNFNGDRDIVDIKKRLDMLLQCVKESSLDLKVARDRDVHSNLFYDKKFSNLYCLKILSDQDNDLCEQYEQGYRFYRNYYRDLSEKNVNNIQEMLYYCYEICYDILIVDECLRIPLKYRYNNDV